MNLSKFLTQAPPTLGAFQRFLDTARPGEVFAYHFGLLADDRRHVWQWPHLHVAANMAHRARIERVIELAQQRLCDGCYAYLAIKRRRGI